ncbi:unnamed protein product [Polarella glacialis]|uniref:Methyltransferase FkbM domain-containing protein n=1 Tax=Polarella glacialis TaxID=89957 RepID=A0A813HNL4_POLGL|nr:unnamed protein product [Polarella glacialis]
MPRCPDGGGHVSLAIQPGYEGEYIDLMRNVVNSSETSTAERVQCTTVKAALKEALGDERDIFFLKIDVEGLDANLLSSAINYLQRVRFLGFESSSDTAVFNGGLLRMLRNRGFACFLVQEGGLLPLFGGVFERASFLCQSLPGWATHHWGHRRGQCFGDVFCARGCDEALPSILRSMPREQMASSMQNLESMPGLAEQLLRSEFRCRPEAPRPNGQPLDGQQQASDWTAVTIANLPSSWFDFASGVLQQLRSAAPCSLDPHTGSSAGLVGRMLLFEKRSPVDAESEKRITNLGRQLIEAAMRHCDPRAALLWRVW